MNRADCKGCDDQAVNLIGRRGDCQVCGGRFSVRANGRPWHHYNYGDRRGLTPGAQIRASNLEAAVARVRAARAARAGRQ